MLPRTRNFVLLDHPTSARCPASVSAFVAEEIPRLDAASPPVILGAAALVTAAMGGAAIETLVGAIERHDADPCARLYDTAILSLISGHRPQALALQDLALAGGTKLFRVRRDAEAPAAIRMLALMVPGDLMANTPLDFITRHLDIRLDLLFLVPGQPLPEAVPDHDVMVFAASEPDAATLARMKSLFRRWKRPVLNDPALLPRLARDRLAGLLADVPGLCAPATAAVSRAALENLPPHGAVEKLLAGHGYPVLIRPQDSHAGVGLKKLDGPADLAAYLAASHAAFFYLSAFKDYRGRDGLYRKYRVAFIDGAAWLCHMAASEQNWMVHYLNAGMTESAEKRAEEARAMAAFDTGFAARHRDAFARLHAVLPFDSYTLDCGELPDGQLLVFEADTAAIIHMMDPIEMFAYKHAQMRRVFDAFAAMLRRRIVAAFPPGMTPIGITS